MTESEVLDTRVGDEHVTPEQIMDVNIGTYGSGDYMLPTGRKCEAQLLSNNSVRVFDGAMVYCGVRDVIAVNNYHDVTIENGQQGMNRNDIIVRHFEKEESTQYGKGDFRVIKGTPTSGTATDPEITVTDLRAGALTHDMKLYRVKLEGLNVVEIEPLFETLPSIPELNGNIQKAIKYIPRQSTKIFTGNGANVLYPCNISDVRNMFGDESLSVADVTVACHNADFDAARFNVESVAWQGSNLVVFLSGNLPTGTNIRINFAFIRSLNNL